MSGRLVPEVLSINTNGGSSGSLEGVASTLMSYLHAATSNDAKRKEVRQ